MSGLKTGGLKEKTESEILWHKYGLKASKESLIPISIYLLFKEGIDDPLSVIENVEATKKGLVVKTKNKTYLFKPQKIYEAAKELWESRTTKPFDENSYKLTFKELSPPKLYNLETRTSITIPSLTPSLETTFRKKTPSSHYSISTNISTQQQEIGINNLFIVGKKGKTELKLTKSWGIIYPFITIRNPYMKLVKPSTWIKYMRKLSIEGGISAYLGPINITTKESKLITTFSLSYLTLAYISSIALPTVGKEISKAIRGKKPSDISFYTSLVIGFIKGSTKSILEAAGISEGIKEAKKTLEEKSITKFVKLPFSFIKGTIKGFIKNGFNFIRSQINALINTVVESYYLIHHILNIPPIGKTPKTAEEFIQAVENIKKEIKHGYYLKAARDIELLLKADNIPPYIKGMLQAYHEFVLEKARTENPFYGILNILSFGRMSKIHKKRKQEREQSLESSLNGTNDQKQWAMGYLTAKLYNPFYIEPSLPHHYSPLTEFETIKPEKAYGYLYNLSKTVKGDMYFHYSISENLKYVYKTTPPSLRPYVEETYKNIYKQHKKDHTLAVNLLINKLNKKGFHSILFPENKHIVVLQLLSIYDETSKENKEKIKNLFSEKPELLRESWNYIKTQYKELLEKFKEKEITIIELSKFIASFTPSIKSLYSLYPNKREKEEIEKVMHEWAFLILPLDYNIASSLISKTPSRSFNPTKENKSLLLASIISILSSNPNKQTLTMINGNLSKINVQHICPRCSELLKELSISQNYEWPSIIEKYRIEI